ncbi:hypothetical protein Tco_0365594 [Tanacetum coccineum]
MSTSKTYQQSLADVGSENMPPMLERGSYIPWATSDEELEEPMEDQPLPADASSTALSPGYIANIADFDPEEDEEDPADHPFDGGDNYDNESSDDDDDDDDVEKDEKDKEEERLALADPSVVPIDDPVPSS